MTPARKKTDQPASPGSKTPLKTASDTGSGTALGTGSNIAPDIGSNTVSDTASGNCSNTVLGTDSSAASDTGSNTASGTDSNAALDPGSRKSSRTASATGSRTASGTAANTSSVAPSGTASTAASSTSTAAAAAKKPRSTKKAPAAPIGPWTFADTAPDPTVDDAVKERIRTDLEKNFLVEAVPGSGKTYNLVQRLLALVLAGRPAEKIVAITFTRKAAEELRSRFRAQAEQRLTRASPAERELLNRALTAIEDGYVGTIHGFCARILREYPIEARLDPGFEELEEGDEFGVFQQSWMECLNRNPEAVRLLIDHDINPQEPTIVYGVHRMCQFPDADLAVTERPLPPDPAALLQCAADLWRMASPLDPRKTLPSDTLAELSELLKGWNQLERLHANLEPFLQPFRQTDTGSASLSAPVAAPVPTSASAPVPTSASAPASVSAPTPATDTATASASASAPASVSVSASATATATASELDLKGVWRAVLYTPQISLNFPGNGKKADNVERAEKAEKTEKTEKAENAEKAEKADAPKASAKTLPGTPDESLIENLKEPVSALNEAVSGFLQGYARYLFPFLAPFLAQMPEFEQAWRRQRGLVSFLDLLGRAVDLLRDRPAIRQAVAEQFSLILVDEFQDTDPLQAELVFLLTAGNAAERDWLKCVPRPGALFLVGDPKQSIYRFRRADMHMYAMAKRRLLETGGEVLVLRQNRRSTAPLCGWVNRAFGPAFAAQQETGQAPFAEMLPNRPATSSAAVLALPLPQDLRWDSFDKMKEFDAEAFADIIATMIGASFPGIAGGRPLTPDDFLILCRKNDDLAHYALALERRGVPTNVSGGGKTLAAAMASEFRPLYWLLRALSEGADPAIVWSVLVGPFFGLSDEELWDFRRAGGRLSCVFPPDLEGPVAAALSRLCEFRRLMQDSPPGSAFRAMVAELGFDVHLQTSAFGLLKTSFLGHVERLFDNSLFSQATAVLGAWVVDWPVESRFDEPGRVRLMTLHKAKGLEAPVVFLGGTGKRMFRPPSFMVARNDPAFLAASGKPQGWVRLGIPFGEHGGKNVVVSPGWDEALPQEKNEDALEKLRLDYVACTRAKDLLIVSRYVAKSGGVTSPLGKDVGAALRFCPEFSWEVVTGKGATSAVATSQAARVPQAFQTSQEPQTPQPPLPPKAAEASEASETSSVSALTSGAAHAPETRLPDVGRLSAEIDVWKKARRERLGQGKQRGRLETQVSEQLEKQEQRSGSLFSKKHRGEAGLSGKRLGSLLHEILCNLLRAGVGAGPADRSLREAIVERTLEQDVAFESKRPAILKLLQTTLNSALWGFARQSPECLTEVPVALVENAPLTLPFLSTNGEKPVLLHGVIDLIFRIPGGWHLVDYKTNRIDDEAHRAVVDAFYRPQLELYARQWEILTGEKVLQKSLLYVRDGHESVL
jgi:ATP-dependent helicase/nuclease subunit A